MYERFTDRARKVMQLTTAEAKRLNHEYIGTEHILLGILSEGTGVATTVIKNRGIDFDSIRDQVDKIVQREPESEPSYQDDSDKQRGWLSTMLLGLFRLNDPVPLPRTPTSKRVVEYAMREARNLNHNYVGTEHLLLGLLTNDHSVSYHVLTKLGFELVQVREDILNLLGHDAPQND